MVYFSIEVTLTKECFSATIPCKMQKNWWNERTLTSGTLKTILQNIVKHIYCDSLFTLWFFPLNGIETFLFLSLLHQCDLIRVLGWIHPSSAWFTHTQTFSYTTLAFCRRAIKGKAEKHFLHVFFTTELWKQNDWPTNKTFILRAAWKNSAK